MNQYFIDKFKELALESLQFELNHIVEIPGSGSSRKYYRIFDYSNKSLIAAYNPNVKENRAFAAFTKHFNALQLAVPEFLAIDKKEEFYLQEDLGDLSLFDLLKEENWSARVKQAFRNSIDALLDMQLKAHHNFDYRLAYPRPAMDKQAVYWDLNYFKYFFLKPLLEHLDEQELEDDFQKLLNNFNLSFPHFFMFRDFQSRNIMIKNEQVYLIDYQGGRKGSPLYDLVSLVYQVKAAMPADFQEELIEHYANQFLIATGISRNDFDRELSYYRFIRFLQVLGAYGYRGYFEKKPHFLQSIPPAMDHWSSLKKQLQLEEFYPSIVNHLDQAGQKIKPIESDFVQEEKLCLRIQSFSYKKGIPPDVSGNGGGFVFDCRILPNPGRLKEYQTLTGKDLPVIIYLKDLPEVKNFLDRSFKLVEQGIDNYVSRGFKHLMVSFGCTGGQHRSVYCAEKLIDFLSHRTDIITQINHVEQAKLD